MMKPASLTTKRYWQQLPRDKADTLLLLAACGMIIGPHCLRLPVWIGAGCAGLLIWRAWLTFNGLRLPPKLVLLPIALVAIAGVHLQFQTVIGKDPGVALLVLLLACKILEMHAKRDLFVVLFLSLFLLLAEFFYSQTLLTAVWSSAALVALLTAQISYQHVSNSPPFWQRLRLSLQIIGLAVPLSLMIFLLFPRIQGPLWGQAGDTSAAKTGLSDTMSPGSISNLTLSDDIAFRAQFPDGAPPHQSLYWRGVVLNYYDGISWSERLSPATLQEPIQLSFTGPVVRQNITLEPNGQRWLFALDLPVSMPLLDDMKSGMTAAIELRTSKNINQRIRYEARSQLHYQLQAVPALLSKDSYLQLANDYDPMTVALGRQLRQKFSDDSNLIREVLRFFHDGNFSYNLDIPKLGRNSADDFLFKTKIGFCEHYASAFVILMRAANIPARVVTGYQGGMKNPVDGYFSIRQSDAHAWAEVWLPNQGWLRIDPTAAVAPERVNKSLSAALARPAWSGLVHFSIDQNSVFWNARQSWEALNNTWNQWVLQYNQSKQNSLFKSLGLSTNTMTWGIFLVAVLSALTIALTSLPLFFSRQKVAATDRVYFDFCRKMAQLGFSKSDHEGPAAYNLRLQTLLDEPRREHVQQFLLTYSNLKYGKPAASYAEALANLKILLNLCR